MDIIVFLLSFVFMEFVAWFTHKYVMHGLLWYLHEDHHTHSHSDDLIERNDSFFLIFATPGILCIILGTTYQVPYCLAIGLGITAYGLCYFLIHDVFIHQRIKWFRNTDNIYFRAIRRAHKVHHKHITKEDGECFGMLWVPLKYFHREMERAK